MPATEAGAFHSSTPYRYYVVWLLFAVYVLNHVDRQLLAILNEPIKAEFGLSDSQLGILGGLAFAALYCTLGIPIARWADRGNRVTIIALALLVWSAFTTATAFAKVTWHLVAARIGVGIGEAGCSPPAYSLIADYFDRKRRATALSIYSMGVYGGGFVGLFIGAAIAERYGWRTAFWVCGAPGILLALIVKLTLREPPRGFSDPIDPPTAAEPPPATSVLRALWAKRSFRWLSIGAAFHTLASYGVGHFTSSFLMRTHDFGLANAGAILGTIVAIGGLSGTLIGGFLSDRYVNRRDDVRYYLWIPAGLLLINIPVGQLVYVLETRELLFVAMVTYAALSASYLAPNIAATHRLVAIRERALASAVFLLIVNLLGLGLGPWLAGALSDFFKLQLIATGVDAAVAGGDGLRWSMRVMILFNLFAVWFYVIAARRIREEAR